MKNFCILICSGADGSVGGEEYQFTLSNCFFLMLGAVLQRGEDICDKLYYLTHSTLSLILCANFSTRQSKAN